MMTNRLRVPAAGLLLVMVTLLSGSTRAAAGSEAEQVLSALVEAERIRLLETLNDFDRLSLRRSQTDDLLDGLYQELDGAIKQSERGSVDSITRLREQIEALEDVRRGALLSLRGMLDRIEESRRRRTREVQHRVDGPRDEDPVAGAPLDHFRIARGHVGHSGFIGADIDIVAQRLAADINGAELPRCSGVQGNQCCVVFRVGIPCIYGYRREAPC